MKHRICLSAVLFSALFGGCALAAAQTGGTVLANVRHNGIAGCFEESATTLSCEPSAVSNYRDELFIANDKPIDGAHRSAVFSSLFDGQRIAPVPLRYADAEPIRIAQKIEGMTRSLDGRHIIATTAFDRASAADASLDAFNTLLVWPARHPELAQVVAPTEREGVISSAGLREGLSRAIRTARYPDGGVPYFKVEGLAAIPGFLLFGIREAGASFRDFDYVFNLVSVPYVMLGDRMVLAGPFRQVYRYDPAGRVPEEVGLSSVEYDPYRGRLYLLTSVEQQERVGGYLWTLSLLDLAFGKPPALAVRAGGLPLRFDNKPEGLAVLDRNSLLVIHDDDRRLVPDPHTGAIRKPNEFVYIRDRRSLAQAIYI